MPEYSGGAGAELLPPIERRRILNAVAKFRVCTKVESIDETGNW